MEKEIKVEEKKCKTCGNTKKILPHVIVALLIFSLAVYGLVDIVKQIVKLF